MPQKEKASDRFRFEKLEAANTLYTSAANWDKIQDCIMDSYKLIPAIKRFSEIEVFSVCFRVEHI